MSQSQQLPDQPSRRDFARVAALTAATAVVPATVLADDPPKPKLEGTPGVGQALAEAARTRYGKNLTDEQLTAIQRSITNSLSAGERLAKMGLKNADEPAVIFRADLP